MSQDAMALHARGFLAMAQRFGFSAPDATRGGDIPITMFPDRLGPPSGSTPPSLGMKVLERIAAPPGPVPEPPRTSLPELSATLALQDAEPAAPVSPASLTPKESAASGLAAKIQAARQAVKEARVDAKA